MSQMQERLSQIWEDSLLLICSKCFWRSDVCDGESGIDVASGDLVYFLLVVCKGILAGKRLKQTVQKTLLCQKMKKKKLFVHKLLLR